MKRSLATLCFGALIVSLSACGMSEEEAQRAWGATEGTVASSNGMALTQALASAAQSASSDITITCSGGGSAQMVSATNVANSNVDASYDVTFSACVEDGITMDGSLSYSTSVQNTMTSSSVLADYVGSMTYSGDVDGECDVDLHLSVESGTAGASVSSTGSFCGFDADAVVSSSASVY